MKNNLIGLVLLLIVSGAHAQQEPEFCGHVRMMGNLYRTHPELKEQIKFAKEELEQFTKTTQFSQNKNTQITVYTIPVVFHIIHNYGTENISDDQVLDAVSILNRDFRRLNPDTILVVDAFDQLVADIGIEFKLATLDPNGDCTSGITRTVSELTDVGDDSVKGLIMWPRNKYMNIWVCAAANGAAGYTYQPPAVNGGWGAGNDGIVVMSTYVGSIGTSSATHSRTLTHEVGHWLNLDHTWGGSNDPGIATNCDMDDGVDDTPNTIGWTSCNLLGASCGNTIDNVQNYMEYSYCSRMFTLGQADRMRSAVLSNVAQRSNLITQANLIATGVLNPELCAADFTQSVQVICSGDSVTFNDNSYHNPTQWTWNFGDGTIISGTDPTVYQNPTHTYLNAGTYNVTLTVANTTGELSITKNALIQVFDVGVNTLPVFEGFENDTWPNADKWALFNEQGDEGFQVTNACSYAGQNCIRLRNQYVSIMDSRDELISASYDLTGLDTVYLSYKWAWANHTTHTNDRLRISASGDCGNNWVLAKLRQGASSLPTVPDTDMYFTPDTITQWGSDVLTLTNAAYFTHNFSFKFEYVAKGGNNLYLDHINLYSDPSTAIQNAIQPSAVFRIFPNPADQESQVLFQAKGQGTTSMRVLDVQGRLVHQQDAVLAPWQEWNIHVPAQAPGVYLIKIQQGELSYIKRIVFN